MSREPEVRTVDVRYQDAEAHQIEVRTVRWGGDMRYTPEYKFKMHGSTAVLTTIIPDGDRYHVRSNSGTREMAAEAVAELPFVQAVEMLEGNE